MQSACDIPSLSFVHLYTCTVLWFSNGTEMEDPLRYSGGEVKPSPCFYKHNSFHYSTFKITSLSESCYLVAYI